MMATSSCNTIVSSSQGDADDLTTLSLLKLSYATTPDLHVKPLYTHLPPRDDIFAVFDRVSSKNFEGIVVKNQRMKIIIGSNTLEDIYLEDLAHQSQIDEQRNGSSQLSGSSRCVLVIAKRPVIAVRYPLPVGQKIRRVQMRFCNGYDYDIAIAILEKVGLPIEERIEQQTSSQSNTNPSFSYRESEQPPMSLEVPDRPALYSHSDSQFQSTNSSARTSRVLEIGLVSRASHLPPDQTPHRSAPDPEGRPPASHFESTTLSAVLPGPHQIHPEPTRHPGYFTSRSDPQKPLYSLHAVRSPTTLGFLATVPADTFNQILPPKRDLPLDEPVAKRRRQRKDIRPIGEVHHKSDVVLPKGGSTLTQAELGKLSNTELGQVFLDLTASEQTELWKTGPKKHAVMKSGQKKPAPEMVIFREAVPKEAVLKKVPIRKTPLRKLASKKAATTTAVVTTGEPLKISIAISPSKHSAKADSKQDFTISLPTISAHDTAADEAAVKGTIPGREVISLSSGNNDVLPLSTSSSNGQTSNRPQISQELVDHAENTIQQYRDRSVAVSTSASPAPTSSQLSPSGLEIYAALSKGERRTIIKRMVVETIMDENFVTLCEDMEDVLQTFGFESRTSEQR